MRLNERLKAIELKAAPMEHGVVIVRRFENVEDAIKRAGLSDERMRKGYIVLPEKNPL